MKKRILIYKADGRLVPFDENKVKATCMRAGASKRLADIVTKNVKKQVRPETTTKEVYKLVLRALASEDDSHVIRHRYRLKESIMLMGPAGFPFEVFIAKLFTEYEYEISGIGKRFLGECVEHEIDITAEKKSQNKMLMIECKYHNSPGRFTGLKESLYTHARFLDLKKFFNEEMLVCNTRISDDAIKYASCIGQEVLGWRFPKETGLEKMIENKGLYPITMFRLSSFELEQFSKNHIMFAKDLLKANMVKIAKTTGIEYTRLQRIQRVMKKVIEY